jgi:hypothetical protein
LTLSLAPQQRPQTDHGGAPTPQSRSVAPAGGGADVATIRHHISVSVRRRRIVGGCSALAVLFALVATVSGSAVLWVATALAAGLALSYAALVTWVVRRAGQRDLRDAFGPEGAIDWGQLESELRLDEEGSVVGDLRPAPEATLTVGALARFAACSVAAWALTPVVMVLRLAGGDLSDLERHDVLGRLVRFQQYGRSRSLQVLTASVAATATVAVPRSSPPGRPATPSSRVTP